MSVLKVAVDVSTYSFTKAGVTVYTRELVKGLRKCEGIEVVEVSFNPWFSRKNRFLRIADTLRYEFIWLNLILWVICRWKKIDVLHSPTDRVPLFGRTCQVTTIHDLHPVKYAQDFSRWHSFISQLFIRKAIQRSSEIVTISAFVKQDILQLYSCADASSISVVHNGVSDRYHELSEEVLGEVLKRYQLSGPFILSVSTVAPNKNIGRTLDAYAEIADEIDQDLVFVGSMGWRQRGIMQQAEERGIQHRVHYLGFVSDEDLVSLYNLADVFLYPSLYEGFGIPPLEAMRCGTPCVGSNVTSLPEVLGDAAWLVDPENVVDIAAGVREFCKNEGLRMQYISRGMVQSRQYSWNKTAANTAEAYRIAYEKFS